jgi:ABC-type uncharacterized transport system substrate-binding protein
MQNTSLPSIGGWGFFVEDGGMVSTGVSPFEQGEESAKMAVEIIEKTKLKLPKVYEAFARATNNYYTDEEKSQ